MYCQTSEQVLMAVILLDIHMCNTSLESAGLCIQEVKNGLISTFFLSNFNKFKGEYTCTAKSVYLHQ